MREIKFRVYNPRDNKMHFDITGFEFIDECEMSGVFIDGAFYLKEEIELMQYTGLKDKNGKEIYEGDILREYSNEIEDWIVSYEYGKFIGTCDNICEDLYELSDLEVIGNIYDI